MCQKDQDKVRKNWKNKTNRTLPVVSLKSEKLSKWDTYNFVKSKYITGRKFNKNFYNSIEWKERRLQILSRDEWMCKDCSRHFNTKGVILQVHHINGITDDLSDSNLITLCTACHKEKHWYKTLVDKRAVNKKIQGAPVKTYIDPSLKKEKKSISEFSSEWLQLRGQYPTYKELKNNGYSSSQIKSYWKRKGLK